MFPNARCFVAGKPAHRDEVPDHPFPIAILGQE